MKITIIAVNREKHPYPVQPLGALYITQALRLKGHEVKLLDLCFIDNVNEAILSNLNQFNPRIIGISIRNIDNTAFPNTKFYLPAIKEIVDFIKCNTDTLIIAGGSGFSVMPQPILNYLGLEMGIIGEGETAFCELVRKIERGIDFKGTDGLIFKDNDTYITNKTYLETLPDRYVERDDLDIERYIRDGSIVNILTKRGCAFQCIYCTYPLLEGTRVRLRNPASVAAEIKTINERYGIDYFYFSDSVFNFPLEHALEICREIIRNKLRIKWTAFFHPKFITAELVEMIVKAGCSGVELGIDAASGKMLTNLKKGFSVSELTEACLLCKNAGINTCCYLLFGGPGEDRETIKESFAVMEKINPTAVIALSGIRIYPGTELADIAVNEGYELGNCLSPRYYIASTSNADEDIIEIINQLVPRYRNLIYEGGSEEVSIEVLREMRASGVKGPLWELKGKY
jgi:radical SAM superfamily enzyme YgiQ (UPF0313 family)